MPARGPKEVPAPGARHRRLDVPSGRVIGETDNPFDVLGLPPTASPEEITERLRDRMQDASVEERAHLRALWERLLRHPRDRVLLALGAHPPVPAPPAAPPTTRDVAAIAAVASFVTPPDELLPLPLASADLQGSSDRDPIAALAAELGELR